MAVAADPEGHRLATLDGNHVKWGEPAMGTGAAVRYAFVSAPVSHPRALNCRDMVPLDGLRARSAIPPAVLGREVAAAFRMWEAAADISFRLVADPSEADILIGAQAQPRRYAFANVSFAADGPEGLKSITKALICLNPDRRWKIGFGGDREVYDLRYTVAHEIGHAIGLDHPGTEGQLMGFRYRERHPGLRKGDRAGAAALYGPRPAFAPGSADAEAVPEDFAHLPAAAVRMPATDAGGDP